VKKSPAEKPAEQLGAYRLATQIVAALFTNGAGQKAERLVLELPNKTFGGGWSRAGATDQIAKTIRSVSVRAAQRRPKGGDS